MIRTILKISAGKLVKRLRRLQDEQRRVLELFNIGGITKDIANIELYRIYKRVELTLKIYTFLITLRVKAQTLTFSMD